MTHFDRTDARFAPRTTTRTGTLSRLALWARAWRELRRMQRLDTTALRDMGLPADAAERTSLRDIVERMAAGR
jgi:uncharacterized protein YjiS (DUF1127 family)